MGMEPAYPEVPATHLCDNHGIRPVQVGKASEWVWVGAMTHVQSKVRRRSQLGLGPGVTQPTAPIL